MQFFKNFSNFFLGFLLLYIGKLNSQSNSSAEFQSNIIKIDLTDTVFLKFQMKNVSYDVLRNNFPFFIVSKPSNLNENLIPKLILKKTILLSGAISSSLKKVLGTYLTSNFEFISKPGFARLENLNQFLLYPLRLNNSGQVEELIDYEIQWQSSPNLSLNKNGATFSNSSVLSNGDWYKIAVTQTGIYKINKDFLTNIGINTTNLDPKKIRIYGNGGKMLPEKNAAFRQDDLIENSIFVFGEEDGKFDNSDYILFYATGPNDWKKNNSVTGLKFKPIKNLYSDTSFYFITLNSDVSSRKRAITQSIVTTPSNVISNSYDYFNTHELDLVNLAKSGRYWLGEFFDIVNSYTFNWNDGDFVVNDTNYIEASIAGLNNDTTQFIVNGGGVNFNLTTSAINTAYYLADHASQTLKYKKGLNPRSDNINLTVSKITYKGIGWLDRLTINARRKLIINAKQFNFRDTRSIGINKVCDYFLTNTSGNAIQLWNVSDPLKPIIQPYNTDGNLISFRAMADTLNEFCVAPANDYFSAVFVSKISNQNLHAIQQADYVVVAHPLFLNQAKRIALLHQQKEGLTFAVATTDQIYNEFSSGRQDVSAIRDFVRMLYSRNSTDDKKVKYLLLMGDGSYNNRSRGLLNNSNFVPTYQSINSLSSTQSTATDDFYGLMDNLEGENAEGYGAIDIGVGRFPCRTVNEVNAVIQKIENYYKKDLNFQINSNNSQNCNISGDSPMGDWRNNLLFLADDGDQSTHMISSNGLAMQVKQSATNYNSDQINLDSYQRYSTPGGYRYPDAAQDLVKRIKKGVLIFNYTGHGGEVGLTEERILDLTTINAFDNFNKLPLFITATCEFSRYDDPARTSAGELCLLNPNGGAIALLTTCRVAYSNFNENLNKKVLDKLFKKTAKGKYPTMGDVVKQTKNDLAQNVQYANFHLLGDPAMPLAYPEQKVITSKINQVLVSNSSSDTLSALEKVTFSGYISDTAGIKINNFNGIIYSTVFDKEQNVICLLNNPSSYDSVIGNPFKFKLQKNILYRGKSQVVNGEFSFTFLVPKDISFATGPGRISYYATNGLIDASGYYNKVVVGGDSKNIVIDTEGPKVNLYLNDKSFINGSITNEKPILYAEISDSSGVNTLGSGIGHDLSLVLDEAGNNPIVLNDYYEANLNSYQIGRVKYPFSDLSEGNHRLSLKVWDIQNNSNTVYTDFVVAKSAKLALDHVLNYPNPFTNHTTFMFEHNQACNPLKLVIQIYTITGKLVKTIQEQVTCQGFKNEGIEWDGKDDFNDKLGRGVYLYKLSISDSENQKVEKIEKLVILN